VCVCVLYSVCFVTVACLVLNVEQHACESNNNADLQNFRFLVIYNRAASVSLAVGNEPKETEEKVAVKHNLNDMKMEARNRLSNGVSLCTFIDVSHD